MPQAQVSIPLADCREIYDLGDVDRALEDSLTSGNDALKALYEKMRKFGGVRYVVKPQSCDAIEPLYERCPNFVDVLDDIKKSLALAVSGNEPVSFTPLLLLGEPGIGKTHFAKHLAQALGTGYEFVSMSSLTAGWVLSGTSSQWNHAKVGKVAGALINGEFANPLMVLDEVDKAGGDSRYDPMGSLYSLFERETARHFKDEFVEVDIDASHMLWVTTANDERNIPEPILNRMNVYHIPRPSFEESVRIATTLYTEIVGEHDWGFPLEAPQEVMEMLARVPPREMRKALMAAFGNAKLDKRDELLPRDLESARLGRSKQKIGF